MKMKLIFALACTSMLVACGSMEEPSGKGVVDDDAYVTGSNLPQRGPKRVQTMTPEQVEDMKRGATMQRSGGAGG